MVTAGTLLYLGVVHVKGAPEFASALPQIVAAGAGVLLFLGLWTPVAGTLVAAVEAWVAFSKSGDAHIAILLAALGASLAMIGPGAWSIDAQLFGRKHIEASTN